MTKNKFKIWKDCLRKGNKFTVSKFIMHDK